MPKERTIKSFGNDLCKVCGRLIRYLHKHHYSKIKKGGFISKKQTIKFFFYRGKLFAYLVDLQELTKIEKNVKWKKTYLRIRSRLHGYEESIMPFLEKYIINNST